MRRIVLPLVIVVLAAGCAGRGRQVETRRSVAPAPIPVRRHVPAPAPRRRPARPPQFVVVSFDGAGGARLWSYWRAVAKRAHAHFSFFLSGVYLVDWAHHDEYRPPRNARGSSAIGFAPDPTWIAAMRRQILLGLAEGHELGTHYNGHFCGAGGVSTWTAADWSAELAQFDRLARRAHVPVHPVGGRTPCLEGNLRALYPVLAAHGFRYDASRTARLGTWPSRVQGLWSIPLLELPFVGHTFRVVSMDYNFMANQVGEPPARIESETYRTLWNAFLVSYRGNRAPLSLGIHFETWQSWAYDRAVEHFLVRACRLPHVRCASLRELVDWLDARRARPARRAVLNRG